MKIKSFSMTPLLKPPIKTGRHHSLYLSSQAEIPDLPLIKTTDIWEFFKSSSETTENGFLLQPRDYHLTTSSQWKEVGEIKSGIQSHYYADKVIKELLEAMILRHCKFSGIISIKGKAHTIYLRYPEMNRVSHLRGIQKNPMIVQQTAQ